MTAMDIEWVGVLLGRGVDPAELPSRWEAAERTELREEALIAAIRDLTEARRHELEGAGNRSRSRAARAELDISFASYLASL
jgi:hypothetical protein